MKNRVIWIVLIVIIVLFGGGLVWRAPLFKAFTHTHATPPAVTGDAPTAIIELSERTVNLADTNATHYLKITLALEVLKKNNPEQHIEERKDKLLDEVIGTASRYRYYTLLTYEGKENMRQELKEGFVRALEKDNITVVSVLFVDFVME